MLFMFPLSKSVSIHAPYIFLSFVLKAIQFYIKPHNTVSFWLILCMYVNMTVFQNMSFFQFSWLCSCLFFLKYFIFSVNFSAHSLSACLHSQRRGWRSEFAAAGGNIKCFAKEPPHPHTFCPSLNCFGQPAEEEVVSKGHVLFFETPVWPWPSHVGTWTITLLCLLPTASVAYCGIEACWCCLIVP